MNFILYYLVFINLFSFFIYGIDKSRAKKNEIRISENRLFFYSLLGGALGCLLGMFFYHHKTRKIKFYLFNIFMLIFWILLIQEVEVLLWK